MKIKQNFTEHLDQIRCVNAISDYKLCKNLIIDEIIKNLDLNFKKNLKTN